MVEFAPDVVAQGLTKDALLAFPAFRNWLATLKKSLARQKFSTHAFNRQPYHLRVIEIQSCDRIPRGAVLFVKLNAIIQNQLGNRLPGIVMLRGGSVAVLMIMRPADAPDERYVIMTEQARIGAGSLQFKEIPSGMIDTSDSFAGVAAREIEEEIGIRLRTSELINMTQAAMMTGTSQDKILMDAIYLSPSSSDEFISIFYWDKVVGRLEMEMLRDKLKANAPQVEYLRVVLEPYEVLLQEGARDPKTLAAWSLYEHLRRVMPEILKAEESEPY